MLHTRTSMRGAPRLQSTRTHSVWRRTETRGLVIVGADMSKFRDFLVYLCIRPLQLLQTPGLGLITIDIYIRQDVSTYCTKRYDKKVRPTQPKEHWISGVLHQAAILEEPNVCVKNIFHKGQDYFIRKYCVSFSKMHLHIICIRRISLGRSSINSTC